MWSTSSACRAAEEDVVPRARGRSDDRIRRRRPRSFVAGLRARAGRRDQQRGASAAGLRDTRRGSQLPPDQLAHRASGDCNVVRGRRAHRRGLRPRVLPAALPRLRGGLSRRCTRGAAPRPSPSAMPGRSTARSSSNSGATSWSAAKTSAASPIRSCRSLPPMRLRRGRLLHARTAGASAQTATAVLRLSERSGPLSR